MRNITKLAVEHSAEEAADSAQRLSGGSKYVTGSPCRHCGGTKRYVITRSCVRCAVARSRVRSGAKAEAKHQLGLAALKRLGLR